MSRVPQQYDDSGAHRGAPARQSGGGGRGSNWQPGAPAQPRAGSAGRYASYGSGDGVAPPPVGTAAHYPEARGLVGHRTSPATYEPASAHRPVAAAAPQSSQRQPRPHGDAGAGPQPVMGHNQYAGVGTGQGHGGVGASGAAVATGSGAAAPGGMGAYSGSSAGSGGVADAPKAARPTPAMKSTQIDAKVRGWGAAVACQC